MVNKKEDIFPKEIENKKIKKSSIWTFRNICLLIGIFFCSCGLGGMIVFIEFKIRGLI